jgi:hypothetical protein
MSKKSPIIVYRFGNFKGMGDFGPFALKLMAYLKMAGIEYQSEIMDGFSLYAASPTGLCPYIRDGEEEIADSSVIRSHQG